MLAHLAAHLYGVPLMIHRPKLDVILAVLSERMGLNKAEIGNFPVPLPRTAPVSAPGVAVIPIHGTLVKRTRGLEAVSGLTSYQSITDDLDAALHDPSITGILLDIDSAGGEANGVFDLADKIVAARQIKPICAVANDSAFSAAYALASSASKVFITRTGGLGSIGVMAMHVDQSAKDVRDGLTYTPIYAGSHKNDLSPHEPLTDAAKSSLQIEVDRLYQLFVETVTRNRKLSAEAIKATEAGLFFGEDAVSAGLADGVGNFEHALSELIEFTQRPVLQGFPMKESQMSVSTTTEVPVVMAHVADDGLNPESISPANNQLSVSDAVEIADLCTLAGCPEQISSYLSARLPVTSVRHELLQKRAQAIPVTSYLTPSPDSASGSDDVMFKAIQKKLAAQPKPGV